ncbi:hypothetical protein ACFQ1Q_11425 [Winogradskyella litorisediminis]|uniref:Methyltransferase FkbM domain-containing protein n=1 Tax=Winogradskyella litorisediminis TaxID=1156618 RepID=A0ABW3N8P5_9FLAO
MLKHFLKKYFLIFKIKNRFSPEVQISQRQLFAHYSDLKAKNKPIKLANTGFRVFSQFEEDGKLLYIFTVLGMKNKTFVEFGSDDGINSNSANLYFNFGWHGLFIDANKQSIERGKYFFSRYPHSWFCPPKFICAKVKKSNINNLIESSSINLDVGFLSIDIDGNDYHIWEAITCIKPDVVMIETYIEFGNIDKVTPYDENFVPTGKQPLNVGASPIAMQKLAHKKGYKLIGANDYGFNLIFLKEELISNMLPEVALDSVLKHPSVKDKSKKHTS